MVIRAPFKYFLIQNLELFHPFDIYILKSNQLDWTCRNNTWDRLANKAMTSYGFALFSFLTDTRYNYLSFKLFYSFLPGFIWTHWKFHDIFFDCIIKSFLQYKLSHVSHLWRNESYDHRSNHTIFNYWKWYVEWMDETEVKKVLQSSMNHILSNVGRTWDTYLIRELDCRTRF